MDNADAGVCGTRYTGGALKADPYLKTTGFVPLAQTFKGLKSRVIYADGDGASNRFKCAELTVGYTSRLIRYGR